MAVVVQLHVNPEMYLWLGYQKKRGVRVGLGVGVEMELGVRVGVRLGIGMGGELQVGDSWYELGLEMGLESCKFGFGWTSCTVVPW